MRRQRADIVVLGAGLAGLAAALAFARHGRHVVVLERDAASEARDADADALFEDWRRPGIAHFRQPHNFLGLARKVLHECAPDVLEAVVALGGFENRQYELLPGEREHADHALVSICARRPVFEAALRRAVENEPRVEIRADARVVGLIADLGPRPRRVVGARTADGSEVASELVVDALGRTSPVFSWVAELGAASPLERRSECGLLYYSRHFRFRPGAEQPTVASLLRGPRAEIGYMAYSVFVEDNATFCPVLMIPPWDRELRSFKSDQVYMSAAASMPALASWVHPDCSEPITRVLPMGSLQNLHRSLVVDGTPVATGVQPIGDALCHTNPTFAYGASLSIWHGFTLADVAEAADDPRAIALDFNDAVGADAAARFHAVSAEDRDRLRLWQGEQIDVGDPADSLALFLRMTAYPAALQDAALFRAVARRVNLLDSPEKLEKDETLLDRAREIAADGLPATSPGPTRGELLERIAAAR